MIEPATEENYLTVPKDLLEGQITTLSSDKMARVDQTIAFALDLNIQ